MKIVVLSIIIIFALIGCGALPKLSVTPVSLENTMGGEHETATDEDNVIKVQTGDSTNVKYESETVEQVYNDIENSPMWLVLSFAFAMGMAIPSPVAAYGNWRRRRLLEKQIKTLTDMLAKSAPAVPKKI